MNTEVITKLIELGNNEFKANASFTVKLTKTPDGPNIKVTLGDLEKNVGTVKKALVPGNLEESVNIAELGVSICGEAVEMCTGIARRFVLNALGIDRGGFDEEKRHMLNKGSDAVGVSGEADLNVTIDIDFICVVTADHVFIFSEDENTGIAGYVCRTNGENDQEVVKEALTQFLEAGFY